MSIVYALVARQQTVLCEFTEAGGNFPTITRVVLRKISRNETSPTANRCTFAYDNHRFHFLLHDELIYLCMTDADIKTNIIFSMLEDMKKEFLKQYGDRGQTAIAYAMSNFSHTLKTLIEKYENTATAGDQFDQVSNKMNSVKNVMVENINKVLERGEKLDILVDKTNNLQHEAFKFEETATRLKRVMWWKNTKLMIAIIALVLVLIWLIISLACGFTFQTCTNSSLLQTGTSNPSTAPAAPPTS